MSLSLLSRAPVKFIGWCRRLMQLKTLPKTGWVEVNQLGLYWRVDIDTYIGHTIAVQGIFEPDTTRLIRDIVKPGMYVLDVGANIGYFTLLLAEAVGPNGHVWAFEPTKKYRDQLLWHIDRNKLSHLVTLLPYGLSDTSMTQVISIGDSSATLHWTGDAPPSQQEIIKLQPLDEVLADLNIKQIDLVKLDIDGHEPSFLRGATKSLRRYKPLIVLEFSQRNLYIAGSDVEKQVRLLQELGYVIYNEKTREPYASYLEFLVDCGNYSRSCNVLAVNCNPDRDNLL